ncbi:MAG: MarR family transcriptional regulator [Methanobrevibacter sp.]|uniref:MarR family winged helix-turn-helix transcriptional regulator n=1 Tax=Methanobrevibacter sp. TaxID=66852 RepID=UPI002600C982|nr:MarR family transcriptional regulator [Methanobrevibacter sp.]MBR3113697.1 MarR family transcriptional regulator [Methanobrevibacter sp.]MBR6994369.1 MarR family transcriptional regulator [Methanobrevibacter sp.]
MAFDDNIPTAPFISIMYREHAKYINDNVKEEELSFGLHPLLIKIYRNEGISQEELAEALHLNESTIARNLKKLEDKGFIERIKDKRKKIIKITPKGGKIAQKVMDLDEMWDKKLKSNLTDEEYDNLLKTLRKISEELI